MPFPKPAAASDVPQTIDLRPSANGFQASAIIFTSIVGAVVGYHAVVDARWLATAGGGVVGMIVGALITGFILMFMPQAIQAVPTITTDSWIVKYRTIRQRFTLTTSVCVTSIGIAFAWHYLAFPTPAWLIVAWSLLVFTSYVVALHYVSFLKLCRCPLCDQRFAYRGAFARFPHCCGYCGFTVDRDH